MLENIIKRELHTKINYTTVYSEKEVQRMPVIQSPGQRINNMRVIEFPLWLRIVCYIIAIIFVLWILRSVYKYIVYQKLIANRKNENAVLVSKVKEAYREVKAYNTSLGSNRPAPGYGSTSNRE